MTITVARVLQDPLFRKCRLLTGGAQAEASVISWVSVIEVPVERFVRRNEFVLTTAMNVGHDSRLLGNFVRRIADSKAAALAIATGPYARTVPAKVISIAEERNLSLIEIRPWKLRFSEISERILQGLLEDQFLKKERDQFLWALATGRLTPDERTRNHAQRIGVVLDSDFHAIAALVRSTDDSPDPQPGNTLDEVSRIAEDMAVSVGIHWQGTTLNGRLVAFVASKTGSEVIHMFMNDWLRALKRRFPRMEVVAGASDLHLAASGGSGLMRYAGAASSALEVVELAAEAGGHRVAVFRDIAVDIVLRRSASHGATAKLIDEYLGALLAHDRTRKVKLLPTLEEYLSVNCNLSTCARNLDIRRQSLMYRLDKIAALSKCDLRQAGQRFALQLALHLRHTTSGMQRLGHS